MAKVITFSRRFPITHPRAGEPTLFVQKMLNSLAGGTKGFDSQDERKYLAWLIENNQHIDKGCLIQFQMDLLEAPSQDSKHHTIRGGTRFTGPDNFSPRTWLDKPYNSPMVKFAPDTLIKQLHPFEVDKNGLYLINGAHIEPEESAKIAANDGLSWLDFDDWFVPKIRKLKADSFEGFNGQIICWQNIHYNH